VIVLNEIVHLWLVELAGWSNSTASQISSITLGQTTTVVAEVVHVVLLSLFFELGHALSCIARWVNRLHWSVTSRITQVISLIFEEFLLADNFVVVWVFLNLKVVVDA